MPELTTDVGSSNPVASALDEARAVISKIKTVMVRIYSILVDEEVQSGIAQIPEVIRSAINRGVEVVVGAIQTIVEGMTKVKEAGAGVIKLLKEIPSVVDATGDLLDETKKRAAMLGARIAAFVVVFVEEQFDNVAKMLTLFGKMLQAIAGTVDSAYDALADFGLTREEIGLAA